MSGSDWVHSDGSILTLDHLQDTAQEVAPGIWQGGLHSATKQAGSGWDVIVNVSAHAVRPEGLELTGALYIEWGIYDSARLPDPKTLHPLVDLLAELNYQGKKLLIHCQAGLNRSGLVTALVLRARGVPADIAIAVIRRNRDEFALCNADFERYVREWSV